MEHSPPQSPAQVVSNVAGEGAEDRWSRPTIRTRRQDRSQSRIRKRFVRARKRIQNQRFGTSRGRLELLRQRQELRRIRHQLEERENAFLSASKELCSQLKESPDSSLPVLWQQMREIRDTIKMKEAMYEDKEDVLAADEYALDNDEEHFYQKYQMALTVDGDDADPSTSSTSSSSPERPKSILDFSLQQATNPLYEYETKIGNANNLRERLDDLILERDQDLEKKHRLELLGLSMDPLDLEFLDTFDETFDETREELRVVEEDIIRLERAAISTGLLNPTAAYSKLRNGAGAPVTFPQPSNDAPHKLSELRPDIGKPGEASGIGLVVPMTETVKDQPSWRISGMYSPIEWLTRIPVFHRGIQFISNLLPGHSKSESLAQEELDKSNASDNTELKPLENWVMNLDVSSRPAPDSDTDDQTPSSQNMEGLEVWNHQPNPFGVERSSDLEMVSESESTHVKRLSVDPVIEHRKPRSV